MPLFDTNALIIATLGPDPELMAATREMLLRERDVALPGYWADEFVGVVTKLTRLRPEDRITEQQARTALAEALVLETERLHGAHHTDVLDVALEYGCTGYDAPFIYWSIELNTPLVTNDGKLCRTVPAHTLPLREYLDIPTT